MPSLGEAPSGGAKPFWLLFWRLKKVTRRKGGTASGRYRSNGYVPDQQEQGQLSGRHREQARSHSLIEVQPGETGRLAPTLELRMPQVL